VSPELREACRSAVHVMTQNGKILRAGHATLFLMEQVGYVWTARFLSVIPIIWAVEMGYWIMARHRKFFARFFFKNDYSDRIDDQTVE
jgi:hypothetical protein